jgi:CO/xanthine dehydrogenase FAD-binding subunit
MIDTDIVYVRPESAEDAVRAWIEFAGQEEIGADGVRYLGGSTEVVTGARKGGVPPRVVIDVKRIAEARRHMLADGRIFFGSAVSLSEAGDSQLFPLLSAVVRRIADRTTRNRLSVGGNIAGALPYREAVLPLLLADATILTLRPEPGSTGRKGDAGEPVRSERPLRTLFEKRLRLEGGELILGFSVPAEAAALPWKHYRATRTATVDYPLVTACFLDRRGGTGGGPARGSIEAAHGTVEAAHGFIEAAVSGLHPYPVFFKSIEQLKAILRDPSNARTDQRATAAYRTALAVDMVRRAEEELA